MLHNRSLGSRDPAHAAACSAPASEKVYFRNPRGSHVVGGRVQALSGLVHTAANESTPGSLGLTRRGQVREPAPRHFVEVLPRVRVWFWNSCTHEIHNQMHPRTLPRRGRGSPLLRLVFDFPVLRKFKKQTRSPASDFSGQVPAWLLLGAIPHRVL